MTVPSEQLFQKLLDQTASNNPKVSPVERWHPDLNGDLDMRVDREGRWFYLGSEILRKPLIKLFSGILKREGDDYFLVTPVEKWRIRVDAAPFVAVTLTEISADGVPALRFGLNEGTEVLLHQPDGLWVETSAINGEPLPFLQVRNGLPALIHRNVFYQLVEMASEEGGNLCVSSCGQRYVLGAAG